MSEQVINIRDRIEKMRTQMTGPNESVARNKIDLEKKNTSDTELKMFQKKFTNQKKPMNPTLNLISLKFHQLVRHTKTTIMIIYMMRIKNLLD